LLLTILICPQLQAQTDKPAAETTQKIRQLAVKYRATRATPQRRADAIKKMAAIGPDGVAAAKSLIEKDMDRMAGQIGKRPNTSALDGRIEELRKTLADLRKDQNLSHAQTENIGLPALNQLTVVYQQQTKQLAPYKEKAAKVAAQMRQLAEVLRVLLADWKQDPPLPVQDYLAKIEKELASCTTPEEEANRKVYEENAKLARQLDGNLVSGMEGVNAMRVMCGLNALLYDLKLCEAARGHSADMERLNFFAHESPVPGKKTFTDRAALAGTTASGENIYMGSAVSVDAIKAWFLSPGHHKNMLGEGHKRQGLGRVGKYWTQEFGA
jgi:uncharacterized protein YkwD